MEVVDSMNEELLKIIIQSPNIGVKRKLSALGRRIEKEKKKESEASSLYKKTKTRRLK